MTVDDVRWILRIGGAIITGLWTLALIRARMSRPFVGQSRVQVVALACIACGIVAIAVSFIPLGGF